MSTVWCRKMASLSPGENWSLCCKWLHSVSIGVPARSTGSSESRRSLVWKRERRVREVERQTAVEAWKAVERKGKEQQKEAERERREGGESEWGGKGEQEQYVERKVLHCTWLFTENEGRAKKYHILY